METRVLQPDYAAANGRREAAMACFARNQEVVDHCMIIIAFPAADRKGGTEDTIRRAKRARTPVYVHLPGDIWPVREHPGKRLRRHPLVSPGWGDVVLNLVGNPVEGFPS